jgi:hypothetical protein
MMVLNKPDIIVGMGLAPIRVNIRMDVIKIGSALLSLIYLG